MDVLIVFETSSVPTLAVHFSGMAGTLDIIVLGFIIAHKVVRAHDAYQAYCRQQGVPLINAVSKTLKDQQTDDR